MLELINGLRELRRDDTYIKTFGNIFFNMEENREIKSIIEQASWRILSIITKYGELANEISYGTLRQDDFIDTVILLNKKIPAERIEKKQ